MHFCVMLSGALGQGLKSAPRCINCTQQPFALFSALTMTEPFASAAHIALIISPAEPSSASESAAETCSALSAVFIYSSVFSTQPGKSADIKLIHSSPLLYDDDLAAVLEIHVFRVTVKQRLCVGIRTAAPDHQVFVHPGDKLKARNILRIALDKRHAADRAEAIDLIRQVRKHRKLGKRQLARISVHYVSPF